MSWPVSAVCRAICHRHRAAAWAALLLGLVQPSVSAAADMLVEGEVVDVVPLGTRTHDSRMNTRCPAGTPRRDDLAALLAWDLRGGCAVPRRQVPAGYRVYYRWDGRTYSRVMGEPPGRTVTLRVHLD